MHADIAIIGSGAAGLFAAIWAGRTLKGNGTPARVIALDGAKTLGAKILVAGGGRCNVTHHAVDETAYAGASRNAIRNVLRAFTVEDTVSFFADLGVELKQEETGKLFPTTDDAHTILNALLRAAREAGVEIMHPWRVDTIEHGSDGFAVHRAEFSPSPASTASTTADSIHAARIILATGGKALPRSGSDGHGYAIARALGHTITPAVFPALVPLVLDTQKSFLPELSGLTFPATLELFSSTNKKLASFTNSTLCTHIGLSGPSVLDISRYYTAARLTDPGAHLTINFLPAHTFDTTDALLAPGSVGSAPTQSILRRLTSAPMNLPERLARALCSHVQLEATSPLSQLSRESRRALAHALTRLPLPITGDRGFTHAEVTAGGVPLTELKLDSMQSRINPNLHICGELCDVDGCIGGFNFQWAWASGYLAGKAAAQACLA